MRLWKQGFAVGACVAMLACGSSGPDSPLILDGDTVAPGPKTLSESQDGALRELIAAGGEECGAIELAFLRDARDGTESWTVRCPEGLYSVLVQADGTAPFVERCFGRLSGGECVGRYRRYEAQSPEVPTREPLNPELRNLLEPMTSKDGKVDQVERGPR